MIEFFWREHACRGAQQIAGPFDTPQEAGQWRRDHPPLIAGNGPTLIKFQDGAQVRLLPGELASCFTEFADRPERTVASWVEL